MNSRLSESVVLITGASEGIGHELTKCFAAHKHPLVLVARNEEKLKRLGGEIASAHGVRVSHIAQDLAVPDGAFKVRKRVEELGLAIDVLVNNAGVGTFGLFAEAYIESELRMMQLNMISVTALTKLFLPDMLKRRRGRILNVASTAAFQPGPLMAVYYASKAYVLSFSEALANELKGTGVSASVLCPGPTRSGFQQSAGMETSKLFRRGVMNASDVAEIAYRDLMRGKTTIIPGWRNKILAFSVRLGPRKVLPMIVRLMQEPAKEKSK
ncbi:MAG TPA: SDR family oxidoreductase [Burkholderiales bacterium]|nr:SDR family oxidoreductase [Burkholderiales bacterium]